MRTIQRDIVSALLFSKDGKLFMGMKDPKDGGVYADCWHIPGGGIEDGESNIDAVVREILEETGINIANEKIVLVDDKGKGNSEKRLKDTDEMVNVQMRFFVYRVDLRQESAAIKILLNDDLAKYKWFEKEELKNITLTPPSVSLFTKLGYLA